MNRLNLTRLIFAFSAVFLAAGGTPAIGDNIDATYKWAWGENVGWVDFSSTSSVTVEADGLSGYAYSEKIGWVKLGVDAGPPYANTTDQNWGVNNDATGNLSGYGFSENAGWVNFSSGDYPERVVIGPDGDFSGYALAPQVGWVNFSSVGDVDYRVKTDWRQATPPPTPSAIARRARTTFAAKPSL